MRLLRLLLVLYPASFRREYGPALLDLYEDRLSRASGPVEEATAFAGCLGDLLRNASGAHLDLLRQDLHFSFRSLRRAPVFAATALLVTALGVGASTAAFSILDAVLVRPLPFPESERLVRIYEDHTDRGGYRDMELSPADFRDWRASSDSFTALGAYSVYSANLVGGGEPIRVDGAVVTGELSRALGIRPLHGRLLDERDTRPGAPGAVVLTHHLWQDRFAGETAIVGQTIRLADEELTVVGVLPPEVRFPHAGIEVWWAARFDASYYEDRENDFLTGIGRLAPGVTREEARAELELVARRLGEEYPQTNANVGASVQSLRDAMSDTSRLLVVALFGASLSVLLVVATNLASLLLARALRRRREIALRTVLGAGRERLVRQLLTESLVLAVGGGLAGVGLAAASTPLLGRLVPPRLPIPPPTVDLRVLAFGLALTTVTGLVFGLVPALQASRRASLAALREGSRAGTAGRDGGRLRAALVIAQVALSLGLLVAAGLLGRTLQRIQEVDPGFTSEGVLAVRTWLPRPRYEPTERRWAFYSEVVSEVEALPGVTGAAYASFLPLDMGGGIWPIEIPGRPASPDAETRASLRYLTPGYFRTMDVPLLAGRDVGAGDTEETAMVAVVSESFVRFYWPDVDRPADSLGRTFHVAFRERAVVGVAADVRVRGLTRDSEPQVYLPARQVPDGAVPFYDPKDLVVRTTLRPESLVPRIREIVARVDPSQPVSDVRTLETIVADQTADRATQSRLLGVFAALAVLLAGLGMHGLLAQHVGERLPELGVRKALGATTTDVLAVVAGRVGRLALAGVVVGTALALAAGRALQSLLQGASPFDPVVLTVAVAVVLLTALLGALGPALRAARVDPMRVLRAE